MPGLDSDTKLLLHLDGADEAQETTDASDSNHTITFVGTAQLDTTAKKWGTASLLLDGDSDYLSALDSADWDIIASNSDNKTIDFWIKFANHTGTEVLLDQYEDADNYWVLYHLDGTGVIWRIWSNGGELISVSGGEISDTNWHHIAVCKVANEHGLYVGGTQVAYATTDSIDTFAQSLTIGARRTPDLYFDGHMDEIRIQHSNYFEAAPVVGKTNTITVPPSSYARDLSINVHDCTDLKDIMVGG